MRLIRFNDHIWYSEYEEERDRPAIGYIKGSKFSVAVDAGHSRLHIDEFYEALEKEGLPLPSLTVLTHWHWDHSFALKWINGLSVASTRTNRYLRDFIAQRSPQNDEKFFHLDPSIEKEYSADVSLEVIAADIEYEKDLHIDAGDLPIDIFRVTSSHTDDCSLIYLKNDKTVFFGDAMSGVFPTWIPDTEKLADFIKTVEELDADHFIGGHWPIFTKEELLKELYSSLEEYSSI